MDLDKWYVRFETAWLLKAKGFNEYCEWGYIDTGGFKGFYDWNE